MPSSLGICAASSMNLSCQAPAGAHVLFISYRKTPVQLYTFSSGRSACELKTSNHYQRLWNTNSSCRPGTAARILNRVIRQGFGVGKKDRSWVQIPSKPISCQGETKFTLGTRSNKAWSPPLFKIVQGDQTTPLKPRKTIRRYAGRNKVQRTELYPEWLTDGSFSVQEARREYHLRDRLWVCNEALYSNDRWKQKITERTRS